MPGSRARLEPAALPARTSGAYSDGDVYRFGLGVGLRTLPVAPREAIKRLILPVEYVRCVENRYVLKHLEATRDHVVLDVGSPKLLSLFLAARVGAQVYATDVMDYFIPEAGAYAKSVLGADGARYRMEIQDARALTYPDDTFDRVFSISVIEHIPDDGDGLAVREIARVLKPGGLFCFTVPWSDRGYLEEFARRGPGAYWVTSDEEVVFYQRAYDRDALERRLLRRSGLETLDVGFWGERSVRVEHTLLNRRLPSPLRYAMLPFHFPLSRLFLRELAEADPSRKKVACLTLRKPAR